MGHTVSVTNTGKLDADDVILGFLQAPGAGKAGVPLQILFGFERVHVKAGETVKVWLYPTAANFIQFDRQGKRKVVAGEYGVHFGVREAAVYGMGFVEATLKMEDTEG